MEEKNIQDGHPSTVSSTTARTVPLNLPMARPVIREYRSVICCGIAEDPSKPDERTMTRYVPYFGEEVEIFTAEEDPMQQTLYRPSLMSKKFGWSTNRIGMLMKRKRLEHEGVFQCIGYKYKPMGAVGLKKGGYFVSIEACKMIEEEFHGQPSSEILDELSSKSSPMPEILPTTTGYVSLVAVPSAALPIRTMPLQTEPAARASFSTPPYGPVIGSTEFMQSTSSTTHHHHSQVVTTSFDPSFPAAENSTATAVVPPPTTAAASQAYPVALLPASQYPTMIYASPATTYFVPQQTPSVQPSAPQYFIYSTAAPDPTLSTTSRPSTTNSYSSLYSTSSSNTPLFYLNQDHPHANLHESVLGCGCTYCQMRQRY